MKKISIRLQRRGRYKKPVYSVVVMFSKKRVQGAALDRIGLYSPAFKRKLFFLNFDKFSWWLSKGAVVSPKVGLLVGKLAGGFEGVVDNSLISQNY